MADIADLAQNAIDTHLEATIANRSTLSVPFSGFCLSCEEPVEGQRRFCNALCSTEWELRLRQKAAGYRSM